MDYGIIQTINDEEQKRNGSKKPNSFDRRAARVRYDVDRGRRSGVEAYRRGTEQRLWHGNGDATYATAWSHLLPGGTDARLKIDNLRVSFRDAGTVMLIK